MKRLGILGGLSAESTVSYYQIIVHEYVKKYGDLYYPEIVIFNANFGQFLDWEETNRWDLVTNKIVEIFHVLATAGAEIGLIATNTLHRVFDEVAERSPIPLISIVDETAKAIKKSGIFRVGLLGTRFTMEADFFQKRFDRFGINTLVPQAPGERMEVHRIIKERLVRGIVDPQDRMTILRITKTLLEKGAQGIVLACTELPLLVRPKDVSVPVFDTTRIHALAALEAAVGEKDLHYGSSIRKESQ